MGAPFVTHQRLRFCDTDSLGHVNNAVYSVMLEAGRAEMVDLIGLLRPEGGFGVVIARLELDFLREMTWPGEIRIETAVHAMGTKSIRMRQKLFQDQTLVARSASVLAVIDIQTRRAVALHDEWRTALDQWLVPEF